MGEFTEKAKGATNEAIGKAKVTVGRATDNPETVVKGVAQQGKGKGQKFKGAVKGAFGDKV